MNEAFFCLFWVFGLFWVAMGFYLVGDIPEVGIRVKSKIHPLVLEEGEG
jgi:hypothetical protein